jgi:hypothetical protein
MSSDARTVLKAPPIVWSRNEVLAENQERESGITICLFKRTQHTDDGFGFSEDVISDGRGCKARLAGSFTYVKAFLRI